jgi:GNAT superfamily N-acetyltransferase
MTVSRVLKLRAMTSADIPAGMRLCRAAGWNQLEEDWRVFLEYAGSGAFLVNKEERAVGTAAFLRYDSFAWIAMMLVDPEERGAGIGAQLLEEAVAAVSDVDCIGLDATPLGEPLYRRFGFTNDYALVRTKATIEAARFGTPSGRARRLQREDLPGVLARDKEVFGADRGRLLRSLLLRAPECAWVVKEGAEVRGYCFGRPGRLYHLLGPVVADERDTACDLVTACFAALDGKSFAIDAPRLDNEWVAWLASVGFAEERPFVRMFLEGHKHPGIPFRQYAIGGPEFA